MAISVKCIVRQLSAIGTCSLPQCLLSQGCSLGHNRSLRLCMQCILMFSTPQMKVCQDFLDQPHFAFHAGEQARS